MGGDAMTAAVQLAFALEPRRDDLTPAEVAGVEARIEADAVVRSRNAWPAPPCRCRQPWPMEDRRCVRCGREVRRA
jgi:hypothetical protein